MALPDVNTLTDLGGPFEILDLGDGGEIELQVTGYHVGRMTIHPRPAGYPKAIVALRVWVPEHIKPLYPDYYDITSQTLIAQLLPSLEAGGYRGRRYTIKKHGSGPQARFSLGTRPG